MIDMNLNTCSSENSYLFKEMIAIFYFIIYLFGLIVNWLTTVGACTQEEQKTNDHRWTEIFLIAITV